MVNKLLIFLFNLLEWLIVIDNITLDKLITNSQILNLLYINNNFSSSKRKKKLSLQQILEKKKLRIVIMETWGFKF